MAYDKTDEKSIKPLCSSGNTSSMFVWSEITLNKLKKRDGDLRKLQLDAVAYLWEICYDLLLARGDNVSNSPGFESLGLRANRPGDKSAKK